ncbi:hypothetical protein [Orrella daihaiensis]|uniref:Autotransporter outer membrane beta-barrel domain-containing protein n=1 Tax=Orrella daihaiensis TaxID=2782176 RepID=A0ABY4ASE5_9BURK|nr:hypothetical protein [Orrella daihaiensis]UOD50959.1 hypothetical protein DHf2319_03310 [Orrella daihaiensis]
MSHKTTRKFVLFSSFSLAMAIVVCNAPIQAQTFVFNNGSNTTISSPSGVTTINRIGNGYTVISPKGVTTVNQFGNGNYNIVGPDGVTSVFSNGSGSYTVIGDAHVVPIVPNGAAAGGGFTAIDGQGFTSEIVPMGDGGLLLIGD